MNTTKGQTETPSSVAVGAPGSGADDLRSRLTSLCVFGYARGPDETAEDLANDNIELHALADAAIALAEQQEARAGRYRKDAARYRWLRDGTLAKCNMSRIDPMLGGHFMDETIDAAIKQEQPHE